MGKGGYHGGGTIIQTGRRGPSTKKAPCRLGVTNGHITERRAKLKRERLKKGADEKELYRKNMRALRQISKACVNSHWKPGAGATLGLALQEALSSQTGGSGQAPDKQS